MEENVHVSPYNLCPEVSKDLRLPENVTIYDTTLRDGEQMPGVAFSPAQKKEIALFMDSIKVPQIELGFPAVSEEEFNTIRSITSEGLSAKTLVLSRLMRSEVDLCVESGADIILLFIATSDLHMEYKIKKKVDEINKCVDTVVSYAKDRGVFVSFSTEDTTRSRMEVVHQFNKTAVDAGARRIGITDTVGCATPEAMSHVVKDIRGRLADDVVIGLHLHNDFGLALANAFAGLKNGANAIATTVCGIGERAGNVPLEEFVVGLKLLYGRDLGMDISGFTELANMVHTHVGIPLPPRTPLVGDNAFTHESGIHVSATLNHPRTYESISPDMVGNSRRLILGKHSGKGIIEKRLAQKGIELSQEDICIILRQIKILGEYKGQVNDEEFWNIVEMVRK
jgi:methanogen homocitrate synthase